MMINRLFARRNYALFKAIHERNLPEFEQLLKNGVDLAKPQQLHEVVPHIGSMWSDGYTSLMKLFHELRKISKSPATPSSTAARPVLEQMVSRLLEAEAPLNKFEKTVLREWADTANGFAPAPLIQQALDGVENTWVNRVFGKRAP